MSVPALGKQAVPAPLREEGEGNPGLREMGDRGHGPGHRGGSDGAMNPLELGA